MSKFPFLEEGKENPKVMVEGQQRERAKEERKSEATARYYASLKAQMDEEAKKVYPEKKTPKILKAEFPVISKD